MKKIFAFLLILCTPAAAQNYLRDTGIFEPVALAPATSQTLTGNWTFNPTSGDAITINTSGTLGKSYNISQIGPTSGSTTGPLSFNLTNASYGGTVTGSSNPFFDNGAWQTWVAAHRVNFSIGTNVTAEPVGAGFYQLIANTNAVGASDGDFIGLAGEAWANATITNGAFHGLVGAAIIGATSNVRAINGLFAEADILTGGVAVARRGVNIVSQGNITATGASDTAINVATSTSAAGFKNMFIIDTAGGTIQSIQATGSILKSDGAFTIANVLNLPSATVTGNILNFPNVVLSGAGFLNLGIGTPDAPLTINANTGASIAPPSGTALHMVGADAALNRIVMDAYANVAVLAGYRANGTRASKTAVAAGNQLFIFGANGWNTSAQVAAAQINFTARETFSGTASGASISVFTTPLTTTGVVESTQFRPSGSVAIGAAAIAASDTGAGTLNFSVGIYANGTVGITKACTIATTTSLTFTLGILTGTTGAGCV